MTWTWEITDDDERRRRAWLPDDVRQAALGATAGELIVTTESYIVLPLRLWPSEVVLRGPARSWRSTLCLRLPGAPLSCWADVRVGRTSTGVMTHLEVLRVEAMGRLLRFEGNGLVLLSRCYPGGRPSP